jgi:hypothetical protein
MTPEILGTVGVVGIVIIAGILIYRAGLGSGVSISAVLVGINNPEADCAQACTQFNLRRKDRCDASFAEAASRMKMEAARTTYWASVGALAAMIAAAVATGMTLPWPANLIVSLVFWTLATILTGVMIFRLGQLDAAASQWQADADQLMRASQREIEARGIVNANCSHEAAMACLATPNPC